MLSNQWFGENGICKYIYYYLEKIKQLLSKKVERLYAEVITAKLIENLQ